jgi:hypothetical protein
MTQFHHHIIFPIFFAWIVLMKTTLSRSINILHMYHIFRECCWRKNFTFSYVFSILLQFYSLYDLFSLPLLPLFHNIFSMKSLFSFSISFSQNVTQRLDLHLEENSIFYKLGSYGLISFSDYVFLLTVLSSEYDWNFHSSMFNYSVWWVLTVSQFSVSCCGNNSRFFIGLHSKNISLTTLTQSPTVMTSFFCAFLSSLLSLVLHIKHSISSRQSSISAKKKGCKNLNWKENFNLKTRLASLLSKKTQILFYFT